MVATFLLIIINIIVFYFLNTENSDNIIALNRLLLEYGITLKGGFGVKSFIGSMFVHANMSHIVLNMIALFSFGVAVERAVGTFVFMTAYFLCGIGGSYASVIYLEHLGIVSPPIVVIGASGAIFGIMAIEAILEKNIISFVAQVVIFHVLLFVFEVPVAWYSHAGGIVVGLLIGAILIPFLSKENK